MNPKEETVKVALKKLFKEDGHFSICAIDNLLKVTGTIPDPETYKMLNAVHCVNYRDMSGEYRGWLFKTVMTMFVDNGFPVEIIDRMVINDAGRIIDITPKAQKPVKQSIFKRLLS